jgi:hypothetical protein
MTGIPSGRFSFFPGLGIQTLLMGFALSFKFRFLTNSNLCLGVKDLTPSTPAVFLPVLSWVTFLTANVFADQDLISSL